MIRLRGAWRQGRLGLCCIMVGQALDLAVLALTLVVLWRGVLETDDDFQVYDWQSPLSRLQLYILLGAAFCTILGIFCCRAVTEARKFVLGFLMPIYLLRLLILCCCLEQPGSNSDLFYVSDESVWAAWFCWAGLLVRWPIEILLLIWLCLLGRESRLRPSASPLRWAVAWLVVEAALQLLVAVGMFAWWRSLLVTAFRLDDRLIGAILSSPMGLARLAVVVSLLVALRTTRSAFAGGISPCENEMDTQPEEQPG